MARIFRKTTSFPFDDENRLYELANTVNLLLFRANLKAIAGNSIGAMEDSLLVLDFLERWHDEPQSLLSAIIFLGPISRLPPWIDQLLHSGSLNADQLTTLNEKLRQTVTLPPPSPEHRASLLALSRKLRNTITIDELDQLEQLEQLLGEKPHAPETMFQLAKNLSQIVKSFFLLQTNLQLRRLAIASECYRQKHGELAIHSESAHTHPAMEEFSAHLFWDTDPQQVDIERHRVWFVRRVLRKIQQTSESRCVIISASQASCP